MYKAPEVPKKAEEELGAAFPETSAAITFASRVAVWIMLGFEVYGVIAAFMELGPMWGTVVLFVCLHLWLLSVAIGRSLHLHERFFSGFMTVAQSIDKVRADLQTVTSAVNTLLNVTSSLTKDVTRLGAVVERVSTNSSVN